MVIEWNKVTWYSKILAVILFVGVFCLGYWIGKQNVDTVYVEVFRHIKKQDQILPPPPLADLSIGVAGQRVASGTLRFTAGKYLDLALIVSERGSDCGGGESCHDFIKMTPDLDLESEHISGLRIDSVKGMPCVDSKIKNGDLVHVQGKISRVVEDIGIVLSCDNLDTIVTKITIPTGALDMVPASILFAENGMDEMYLTVDVLSRNPDFFPGFYEGPDDGKDRKSFYLNKSTELRRISLTSRTKFIHCQRSDGVIPVSMDLNKEFSILRHHVITERTHPTWSFGVVRNISAQDGEATEVGDVCVP